MTNDTARMVYREQIEVEINIEKVKRPMMSLGSLP
jgi:hypothetical protein